MFISNILCIFTSSFIVGGFMGNVVNICQSGRGQFFCTFPKGIAEALRLKKKDKIEFIFDKGDLIIRKI